MTSPVTEMSFVIVAVPVLLFVIFPSTVIGTPKLQVPELVRFPF